VTEDQLTETSRFWDSEADNGGCVEPITYDICSTNDEGLTWTMATVTEDQLTETTQFWNPAAVNGGCVEPSTEVQAVAGEPPVVVINKVLDAGPLGEAPAATAVLAEASFAG
jgi:hypothetical protein